MPDTIQWIPGGACYARRCGEGHTAYSLTDSWPLEVWWLFEESSACILSSQLPRKLRTQHAVSQSYPTCHTPRKSFSGSLLVGSSAYQPTLLNSRQAVTYTCEWKCLWRIVGAASTAPSCQNTFERDPLQILIASQPLGSNRGMEASTALHTVRGTRNDCTPAAYSWGCWQSRRMEDIAGRGWRTCPQTIWERQSMCRDPTAVWQRSLQRRWHPCTKFDFVWV